MPNTSQLNKEKVDSFWKDVWMKFKSGDVKAFELIYGGHVDFLYSYGTKMTADTVLVEDAIHDLFLYLLSKKENLTDPDFIRYYLLKAFKRILLERITKENLWLKGADKDAFLFDFSIESDTGFANCEKERQT